MVGGCLGRGLMVEVLKGQPDLVGGTVLSLVLARLSQVSRWPPERLVAFFSRPALHPGRRPDLELTRTGREVADYMTPSLCSQT
jgi:hypothetical protein